MMTTVSDKDIASSILSFVEFGSYPESDAIATSDLSTGISALLEVVSQAEEALKVLLPLPSAKHIIQGVY
jgi:hypothetical protein